MKDYIVSATESMCHTICSPCCKPCLMPCDCQPNKENGVNFYAQYGVATNGPSGSLLPYQQIFRQGDQIELEGRDTIVLSRGYLYLIDYIFLATPEANSYMQIVPRIDGSLRSYYAFFAPSGSERNTSASGSFTTNEAANGEIRLSFVLTYPSTVNNIDLTGSVSITPLMRIGNETVRL